MAKHVMVFTETALALSETFIAAHCRSLQRYAYTMVAVEKSGDNYPDIPRTLLIAPGTSPRIERLLFRLGWSRKMGRLLDQLKPDLIHAHYMMSGAFILPYARRRGIPVIVTGHGYDVTRRLDPKSAYGVLYAFWRRALIKSVSAVLPVSHYLKAKLLDQGFRPQQVKVHYLGIGIPDREMVDILSSPPRIVYAGRLVEKKGLDKVIEAFAEVRKTMPQAELHIAGDGPLRAMVEQAAAEIGNITCHGSMPNAAVLQLMASARVFTMPSREAADGDAEGFGLVLIEAQVMGVPVVTSNETGAAEAVQHGVTGLAVNPRDSKQLADAYLQFLNSPERAADMGAAAYRFVRQNFDIRKQTMKLEDFYDTIVPSAQLKSGTKV